MIDYIVTRDVENHCFIVKGNFIPGSIPINIPNTDRKRNTFISLFLNKKDIESGIDYLHCISLDKHFKVNQGLILAALSNLLKCFQNAESRYMLSEEKFKKFAPQLANEYERFKLWRNKHFLHDVNSMTETSAFLLLAPENSGQKWGGEPSVIWNDYPINYLTESKKLEEVMQGAWQFIVQEIDNVGKMIIDEYNKKTREELLTYGVANIKLASIEALSEPRIAKKEKS